MLFTSAARAHMSLKYPAPLGGAKEFNPLTTQVDDKMNFPFGCCDADGAATLASPGDCRGHLNLLDTEEGKPQVIWEAGQNAHFQLSDHTYTTDAPGSTHYGGSCQIGFSIDKGQTWRVAASYHGSCPHRTHDENQIFNFRVPTGIPNGPAVFAWIWLNREHESFMNCASIQIGSGSQSTNMTVPNQGSTIDRSPIPLKSPRSTAPPRRGHLAYTSSRYDVPISASSVSVSAEKRTGSHQEHFRQRHSIASPQYYFLRAVHQSKTPRELAPTKRVLEVCNWNSAPTMETSYFTIDAKCAPGAKKNNPKSDEFEIGWSDACGIVEGDGQYRIEDIKC